jgi:hypothetical protein
MANIKTHVLQGLQFTRGLQQCNNKKRKHKMTIYIKQIFENYAI